MSLGMTPPVFDQQFSGEKVSEATAATKSKHTSMYINICILCLRNKTCLILKSKWAGEENLKPLRHCLT